MIDRRTLLAGAAITPAAAALATAGAAAESVRADLERYIAAGGKASGGSGDEAVGASLAAALLSAGYDVERQTFDVPWFEATKATLVSGDVMARVVPQAIVVPTGASGVSGKLVRVTAARASHGRVADAIALVELPHNRWSTAAGGVVKNTVQTVLDRGARAAVVVTTGPTGDALALNAPADMPLFDRPVATLAPRDAAPFFAAAEAGGTARLTIDGRGGRRPATNLIARRDCKQGRWLIVSTPRSGWFGCAGERGGGVAAWLGLARWAVGALPHHDLAFVCTSGHEYEYRGAEAVLQGGRLPDPSRTALWLHLGANVAARDWQELTGTLLPLPSADTQRYLMTSEPLISAARKAFAGLPGLEAPHPAGGAAAGELAGIFAAGYPSAAGIFGAHRYHHSVGDDARCVDAAMVGAALSACQAFVLDALR